MDGSGFLTEGAPVVNRIAMFGDSTTFGAAPHQPPYACTRLTKSIPQLIAEILGADVRNEAVNGAQLTHCLSGVYAQSSGCGFHEPLALAQYIDTNPEIDLYLFCYGINEAASGSQPDYTSAIAAVQAAGKTIALVEPYFVDPSAPSWDTSYLPPDLMARVNAIRAELPDYGVPVITVSHLDSTADTPDGLHPSQAYAEALAQAIAEQIVTLPVA